MFLNDSLFLSICLIFLLQQFFFNISPLSAWFIGGIFLLLIGGFGLVYGATILIGFLWVIDFGVGLIFLIFLSSLTPLFEKHVKGNINLIKNIPFMITFFSIFFWNMLITPSSLEKWSQLIPFSSLTHISYYNLIDFTNLSILNILRDLYFLNQSWLFIVINFFILFGLGGIILFNFSFKLSVNAKTLSPLYRNKRRVNKSSFFIRDQNILYQQNTASSTRIWVKKKSKLNP